MTPPPPTRREAVTDRLHGVVVDDPFRWLEHGDAPDVRQWVAAQNHHTREALDARPDRGEWHERLVAFMGLPVVVSAVVRDAQTFVVERFAGADQLVLTLHRNRGNGSHGHASDGVPTVLVDPTAVLGDSTAAIDWFHPSDDGAFVAIGLSTGGTENSTLRILDVAATLDTGEPVFHAETIPNTRACSLAWEPDGTGFLYTRYPDGDEYHRTVHAHRLGDDPAGDPVVWAEHVTPQAWPSVDVSPDGRWILVHVMVGWGHVEVVVLDRSAASAGAPNTWQSVVTGIDATSHFVFDRDGTGLVGTTTVDAPLGRVVTVDLGAPAVHTTLVPERDVVVGTPVVAGPDILLVATSNAVDRLERWTADGAASARVDLGIVTVASLSADRVTGRAVAVASGYESPNRLIEIGPAATVDGDEHGTFAVHQGVPDLTVTQVTYPSLDGTEIGMFLIHRADVTPSPDTPTILYGYGGFAIAMTPGWSPTIAAWCDRGGVYAVAGLRGGIERGEPWHEAGRRERKQNVFDDFHAAADWLVETGRTSRQRLAIDGRSNGGLLVGAALTQRPDLCAAVSCGVALLDMIRFPQFLIARLWTDEYGDPDVADEFAWLHAYSPYHNVVDGVAYPPTLLWTAEGDTRVDPMHARKMAARLQAATADGDGGPILLRQEGEAGHGVGKPVSKRADEQADVLTFLSWFVGAG